MGGLSVTAMIIRFILGGSAVLASSIIAKKAGSRIGGIFAAFPAVYLAALLTLRIDPADTSLITNSIQLSRGALIGMAINILCAAAAGFLCSKKGWKTGLVQALAGWAGLSIAVAFITSMA